MLETASWNKVLLLAFFNTKKSGIEGLSDFSQVTRASEWQNLCLNLGILVPKCGLLTIMFFWERKKMKTKEDDVTVVAPRQSH